MSFNGDPFLFAQPAFVNGQPAMDRGGLVNSTFILLLTEANWPGNYLETDQRKRLDAGRFLNAVKQPITRSGLNDIRMAAEADLAPLLRDGRAKEILVNVTNPVGDQIAVEITLTPPSRDPEKLRLTRAGQRWLLQILDPVTNGGQYVYNLGV